MGEEEANILKVAEKLLESHALCDSCLGRQFATLGYGMSNSERGRSLKTVLMLQAYAEAEAGKREKIEFLEKLASNGGFEPASQALKRLGVKAKPSRECEICRNVLSKVSRFAEEAARLLAKYEYESFLVGVKVPAEVLEAEDSIRGYYGLAWGESIKSEFSREIGKAISKLTGRNVEFKNPDVVVTVSPYEDKVEVKANPIFIEGRYRKLVAGIPQARWLCSRCRGKGCEACNWTGKKYPESVEEIIEKPILEQSEGEKAEFHAGGREDIDARVLGTGRPFVVEVKDPKRRSLNLDEIAREINSSGKVEVEGLRMADRGAVARVKSAEAATKTYRIVVEAEEDLQDGEFKQIEEFFTGRLIRQWTPRRVLHRRANKEREKMVYSIQVKPLSKRSFEAVINCQGGLYVKELVDGDEGRTKPSMAEVLGKKLKCVDLTVLRVG